jgi:hypothetical protein
MSSESGVTVYMRVQGEDSTVNYPRATTARVEVDGSLTLLGMGGSRFATEPEPVGSVASGLWTRWIYNGR